MQQIQPKTRNESAVSPVVGVMLMLVVVIIIAAVVSGFAGSLVTSQKTAPTLTMDVAIKNSGTWLGSGFYATVTGVSAPIPTSDLKIVTTWTAKNRNGGQISGGATILPGVNNTVFSMMGQGGSMFNGFNGTRIGAAPFAVGPGVGLNGTQSKGYPLDSNPTDPYWSDNHADQNFGNYWLMQGTNLFATPAGAASMGNLGSNGASSAGGGYGITTASFYTYVNGSQDFTCTVGGKIAVCDWPNNFTQPSTPYVFGQTDPMQAILGQGWENLMPGSMVNMKVIHIPSGKVIFQKDIAVTEG